MATMERRGKMHREKTSRTQEVIDLVILMMERGESAGKLTFPDVNA